MTGSTTGYRSPMAGGQPFQPGRCMKDTHQQVHQCHAIDHSAVHPRFAETPGQQRHECKSRRGGKGESPGKNVKYTFHSGLRRLALTFH